MGIEGGIEKEERDGLGCKERKGGIEKETERERESDEDALRARR